MRLVRVVITLQKESYVYKSTGELSKGARGSLQ